MARLRYSRSQENEIEILEDRLFNAILDVARSDSGSVDFTSKSILMKIYTRRGGTLADTLTSGTEITISTARLTFNKTFTDLTNRAYYYQLYNDTDKIGISHGKFIVE